jgi:G8 domain
MTIDGYRCVVNCEAAAVENVTLNETLIYWSSPTSWVSGKVPVEDEEVEILPGVNMILDISTPILKKLSINGRLTFLNNLTDPLDLELSAKIIYVRAGELFIGNSTNPFNGNATIRLYGNSSDETLAYSASIEGGNKILAVLGTASLYGKSRSTFSRLRATINSGDKQATVQTGLDWVPGD